MRRLVFLMALLGCGAIAAQDPDHFLATGLLLNPATSGFAPGGRVLLLHQDPWLQSPGTWPNDALAAEWSLRNSRKQVDSWMGLGLIAARAWPGAEGARIASVGLVPAVHLRSGPRSWFSSGLELRWANGQFGEAEGSWASQYTDGAYHAALPSGEAWTASSASWLEARAGLCWTLKQEAESRFRRQRDVLVAGVAVDHPGRLLLHQEGSLPEPAPMRFTAHVLAEWPLAGWENGFLSGECVGQAQGPFRTARLGLFAGKHLLNRAPTSGGPPPVGFKAGVGYRWNDALLASACVDIGQVGIGMAYGWGISGRDAAVAGARSVELLLQLRSVR
jgi:hypothetical protein